mmetsp:Transcript_26220/g.46851  ORF Transcript_26220/g.46851 Transcript_26220/m.46851 type:complete len:560 (-) Transcript_26220:1899-3578(-)
MNRKLIFFNYMKSWFFIDLIATFPLTWISDGPFTEKSDDDDAGGNAFMAPKLLRLFKIFRFMRILKLLRIAKLTRILMKIEDYISSNFVTNTLIYLKLLVGVFFLAHWTACMWHYLGANEISNKASDWYTTCYIHNRKDPFDEYVAALYWSFTTMTTVGYGDIVPITIEEKIFCIFAMLLACGVFAYTLGSVSSLVSRQSQYESNYRSSTTQVIHFMKKFNVPPELQFRVRRYLEYLWEATKENHTEDFELLDLLSGPLKDEMCSFMHSKAIKACPVFDLFNSSFVGGLTRLIKLKTFSPSDVIFSEGQVSTTIYFIKSGTVAIYHCKSNSIYINLVQGKFFGEISFFTSLARTASAKCLEFTSLLVLERKGFNQVAATFPDVKNKVQVLEKSCSDGDIRSLGVRCYMCKLPGHAAKNCDKTMVHVQHELALKKWLSSRKKQPKSIKVDPQMYKKKGNSYKNYPKPYLKNSNRFNEFHSAAKLHAKVASFCSSEALDQQKVQYFFDNQFTLSTTERKSFRSSDEELQALKNEMNHSFVLRSAPEEDSDFNITEDSSIDQ